ncbi:S9 family peptidase [Candidatus Bathyarchaeota archaeon]|nr:S9 family peptidase [Candidatus Bathyarchaeota archaeon]
MKYSFKRFLNIRSATSPSFSHDGNYVVFLTNITGTPQVWRVPVGGGWPEQLTYYDERVRRALCSPTEDRIAFATDLGGNERDQIYLLSPGEGVTAPLVVEPGIIHGLGPWSPDGKRLSYRSNGRNRAFFDIYVVDISSGESRRVLEQDGWNVPEAWSHDGRCLLVRTLNTNLDSDLYLIDLKNGEVRCLTAHSGEATYSTPVFTPDDRSILCLTNRDREFMALVSLDVETSEEEKIVEEHWDLDCLALNPDGDKIAYTVNEEGYSRLRILNLHDGSTKEIEGLPPGVVSETTWSPDGELLAFTFSGSRFNPDIWLYDTKQEEVLRLTRSDRGGIPQEVFVEPELIRFKTFDGRGIPAFLFMPKTWEGEKPPAVVQVHGGPESQSRPRFNPIIQYLVNHGFAVLSPNVRGSRGYGKTYIHLDDVRKRMDSVHDLKYAHKWLVESGRVDPRRIAIYGGSYGGFMVLAALTTYPDLWAAGVDLYGIANFVTFLENTGPWRRSMRAAEYGDPVRDREFLTEISPVHKADKIMAPLLVVHGVNDPRVPKSETDQIVEALKRRGVAVKYILFDDEGHGIVKLKNRLVAYGAILEFLEEHLKARG